VLRSLAPVYTEQGRYEDAIAAYRDYIEITGAQEAHLGLARVLLQAEQAAEALETLDALSPRSPRSEIFRAYALARLGRHAEARAAVDQAFAAQPEAVERLRRRAALVLDVAPLPDGEAELRGLLDAAPEDAALKSWLGYYLAVWGRPEQSDEAFELLKAAAEEAPEDPEILGNLGWGAHKLGRHAEAVEALEAALALDEGRHLERVRLGHALRAAGQPARALALLRQAVALRPGARWAKEARQAMHELEQELPGGAVQRLGPEEGS
jgi:tetratricopeptide (TPR) repeat protein